MATNIHRPADTAVSQLAHSTAPSLIYMGYNKCCSGSTLMESKHFYWKQKGWLLMYFGCSLWTIRRLAKVYLKLWNLIIGKLILQKARKNFLQMSSVQSLLLGYFEQLFVECDEFRFEMEGQPEITGIVRCKAGLSCQINNFQMIHLYDFNGKLPGGKKCNENLFLLFWVSITIAWPSFCWLAKHFPFSPALINFYENFFWDRD